MVWPSHMCIYSAGAHAASTPDFGFWYSEAPRNYFRRPRLGAGPECAMPSLARDGCGTVFGDFRVYALQPTLLEA